MPAAVTFLRRSCLLTLLIVLAAPGAALAQDVTGVALRAAFIYNFVRFTDWPPDVLPPGAAISACVLGDDEVAEALERTVKGREVTGRSISVSTIRQGAPLPVCHLLYAASEAGAGVGDALAAVQGAPVLTVSDGREFTRIGGMIQLVIDAGKMRFSINLEAARRARLQLSSRLLALADLVTSGAHHESAAPGAGEVETVARRFSVPEADRT
jgi:hypothetical protein